MTAQASEAGEISGAIPARSPAALSAWLTGSASTRLTERLAAEWVPFSVLTTLTEPWQALSEAALEPNVFYEPGCAIPAARVFGTDLGAVLIRAESNSHQLLGVFPGRIARRRWGAQIPVLIGWTHPYAPLGTPLVDRDYARPVIAAFMDFLAKGAGPKLALFPMLPSRGPVATILRAELGMRRGRMARLGSHQRAMLAPPGERTAYLLRALSAKKRKELGRQRRRLIDHGHLHFRIADAPSEVSAALAEFMQLEARGWKGQAGTAAVESSGPRHFMQQAVLALAERRQVRITRLLLDDRAIASALTLHSGADAWFWKIAYDEEFARYSPGVQLTEDLTRLLLNDPSMRRVDSCAIQDHPMIDHFWRERLELADHLLAPSTDSRAAFTLGVGVERSRGAMIRRARALRRTFLGR
jgi:Acetyltransferase (GNAT) domain